MNVHAQQSEREEIRKGRGITRPNVELNTQRGANKGETCQRHSTGRQSKGKKKKEGLADR